MSLNKENITKAWENTIKKIEGGYPCSSEKTLVFLIACEIKDLINNDNLKIDFESKPYQELKDDFDKEKNTYLDLLIYTDENYKIAIEIKFPFNSNGSTNQTQSRKKIYRDLYRLEYLVTNNIQDIKAGYFLMIITEDAYLNNGEYKSNYHTYHTFNLSTYQPSTSEYKLNQTSIFKYKYIDTNNEKITRKGNYAYLEPIYIQGRVD